MTDGVVSELSELISLKQYAPSMQYALQGTALQMGNHLSRARGRGMDFSEVRNYQAGDDIRHMEWRVTARTGRPHIKLYQEERERPVVMLVDFNPSMLFGTKLAFKSVLAARLSALIAWTTVKQGDRIGGLLFSAKDHYEFIPRARESGVLPMLAALSRLTMQSPQLTAPARAMQSVLLQLRRVVKPGSIVTIISDFYAMDASCEQHLSRLRSQNDVIVYHILDPIEIAPPKPQQYAITDGRQEMILDTRLHSVREGYENYCQTRIQFIKDQCKRTKVQYMPVNAETDLVQLVRATLPRRARG
jgi:uncharacterized protein (DUF58 family)